MKHRSGSPCTAPAEVVFELLERDRTEFRNDEVRRIERVGDTPFGPGYRTKATIRHSGELCTSEAWITIWDPPRVLHEEWVHHCRQSGRTLTGTMRFEVLEDPRGIVVVCETTRRRPGIDGLIDNVVGVFSNKARLTAAYLAMRAEAAVAERAGDAPTGAGAGRLPSP